MPGETKEQFMTRVRDALKDRGKVVDLPNDLEVARVIPNDGNVVAAFIERAEQAHMQPYRVNDDAAVAAKVSDVIDELQAKSAIVPDENIPARDAIIEMLKTKNIELLDVNDSDAAFTADVGITGVTAAVAETASMILSSGQGKRRLASLAVPAHVAVVRADQIMPDTIDWFADSRCGSNASDVLVSAPSKTADIELSLVMGVHGPKTEHIIVVG